MNPTGVQELTTEEAAQLQEAIEQGIAEIRRIRERIKEDRVEIERSRTRTQAALARLRSV